LIVQAESSYSLLLFAGWLCRAAHSHTAITDRNDLAFACGSKVPRLFFCALFALYERKKRTMKMKSTALPKAGSPTA
jgi:hypothetical protein